MSLSTAIAKEFKAPSDFVGSGISEYLKGRCYDSFKVKQILKVVTPIVDEFNGNANSNEDLVMFRISMSAKHQSLLAKVEAWEQDVPIGKFDNVIGNIESAISELLEEGISFENNCSDSYCIANID